MGKIVEVHARQILDSRGSPTVEVDVRLESGARGRAAVPSGASTGQREALELRDADSSRFRGKSVLRAVANVNTIIASAVIGLDATDQRAVDQRLVTLDGSPDKGRLGANALLGVSMAVARASAAEAGLSLYRSVGGPGGVTLPVPLMNVLNGGVHADNRLDLQEFMIVPTGTPSFTEALRTGVEIFWTLKDRLKAKGYSVNVGDEGGFAPDLSSTEEALDLLMGAIEAAGRRPGRDVWLALDVAASGLHREGCYHFEGEGTRRTTEELIAWYGALLRRYPICSIEDGLGENDWEGWMALTRELGGKVQLVGDDLFVTNPALVREGIAKKAANAVLIKVNQIGTLTETREAVTLAQAAGWRTVISHRSGETEDPFIADLAVAVNAGQIKTGSLARSDRVAKYNQLLRIEEELGRAAVWPGPAAFASLAGR